MVTINSHVEFFLTSSPNRQVRSDRCEINLLRYAILLRFWKRHVFDSPNFSRSGEISFPDILCPKNISLVAPKTHLSLFCFKPDFRILFKTCLMRMPNWFRVDPHMMIMFSLPLHKLLLFPRCHYVSRRVNASIEVCRKVSKMWVVLTTRRLLLFANNHC